MKILTIIILIILFALNVVGQRNPSLPNPITINEEIRQQTENRSGETENLEKRKKEALKQKREQMKEVYPLLEEIYQRFPAPAEYFTRYSDFLKKKDTGLARVFPDNGCGREVATVSLEELERCRNRPQIIGGGSFYSFRFPNLLYYVLRESPNVQTINYFINESDIRFINGKFVVGKNLTQDIIVETGDVNLENITDKSDIFKFLEKWEIVGDKNQLNRQNQILEKGIRENGYFYSNQAEVKNNATYLLRSIAYAEKVLTFWNTDQIVAFKVTGQEADGSIIILWKKMREKNTSSLAK